VTPRGGARRKIRGPILCPIEKWPQLALAISLHRRPQRSAATDMRHYGLEAATAFRPANTEKARRAGRDSEAGWQHIAGPFARVCRRPSCQPCYRSAVARVAFRGAGSLGGERPNCRVHAPLFEAKGVVSDVPAEIATR
jgi:hypothetical protein